MSRDRAHRLDRDVAERLLRGEPAGQQAGPEELSALLAAAAAPGREGELAGEWAAMAAFREARLAPVSQPRRRTVIKTAMARLLTVKLVAAAALTATTAGGVGLAASTGTLPRSVADAVHAPRPHPSHPAGKPTSSRTAHPRRSGNPSPSMTGLCHAYTAHPRDHGKSLSSPAFTALAKAAGGKDKVDGFCAATLRRSSGPHPATPTASPTPLPTDTPTAVTGPGRSGRAGHGRPADLPKPGHVKNSHPPHPNGSPTAAPPGH